MKHPAKYSDSLLPHFEKLLCGRNSVLDPFAGTGKLRLICPSATLLEIEPEWAVLSNAIVGDALDMPRDWKNSFDAVCTSPCYGNRMADSFNARDSSKRNTYHHTLGRKPNKNSSATLQWGDAYRDFHSKAWREVRRVLKDDGIFIMNISDHIRRGEVIKVTDWHIKTVEELGFTLTKHIKVQTPRNKFGANRARVEYESILVFEMIEYCDSGIRKEYCGCQHCEKCGYDYNEEFEDKDCPHYSYSESSF